MAREVKDVNIMSGLESGDIGFPLGQRITTDMVLPIPITIVPKDGANLKFTVDVFYSRDIFQSFGEDVHVDSGVSAESIDLSDIPDKYQDEVLDLVREALDNRDIHICEEHTEIKTTKEE